MLTSLFSDYSANLETLLMTFTDLCRMYFPILINWTSPYLMLWLLGGSFHFYSNFKINFC